MYLIKLLGNFYEVAIDNRIKLVQVSGGYHSLHRHEMEWGFYDDLGQ